MTKSFGAKGLTGDAKAWNDAAPAMARQNAKSPMVIEQSPNGMIMGRAVSAKPTASRGMGKMAGTGRDDSSTWNNAAPRMERQNNLAGPMVYTQDAKSGKISGEKVGYRTFDRNLQRTGSGTSKAQGAYINDGSVPMVKGKKKLEMCPDCGKPMFGGKCSCGDDMGKGMRKVQYQTQTTSSDGRQASTRVFNGVPKAGRGTTAKAQGAYINNGTVPMTKGDMCKCGSGMSKSMCKCGGMTKSAKKSRGTSESMNVKLSPAEQAEQARWDGLTKGTKPSMRKAMPIAQPNPTNSRPIQDPGLPPKMAPLTPPRNPGPMKPMPVKPAPGKLSRPMPMSGTPGQSGKYGGINPAGMYGKVSKRSK